MLTFVLRNGIRIEKLVQVCYDMSSPKTQKREIDSLIECAAELNCSDLVVITNEDERIVEKNGFKIRLIPISKF